MVCEWIWLVCPVSCMGYVEEEVDEEREARALPNEWWNTHLKYTHQSTNTCTIPWHHSHYQYQSQPYSVCVSGGIYPSSLDRVRGGSWVVCIGWYVLVGLVVSTLEEREARALPQRVVKYNHHTILHHTKHTNMNRNPNTNMVRPFLWTLSMVNGDTSGIHTVSEWSMLVHY